MKATKFIAVGALALASATFAEGLASDVVGYMNNDMTTKQYNPVGVTFITVGAADKFKLGDIAVEGFDFTVDILQVLSDVNASTVKTYTYVTAAADAMYFGGTGSAIGWWVQGWEGEEGYEANEVTFDACQGFLCNFSSKAVKFTYAGQVITGKTEVNLVGKQYNLIANFLPRNVKMGEIAVSGFDFTTDILQVLSDVNASTIKTYTYVTPEADAMYFGGAGSAVGWWIQGWEGEEGYNADEDVWSSGAAYLGNFSSKAVKMTFPEAIK